MVMEKKRGSLGVKETLVDFQIHLLVDLALFRLGKTSHFFNFSFTCAWPATLFFSHWRLRVINCGLLVEASESLSIFFFTFFRCEQLWCGGFSVVSCSC